MNPLVRSFAILILATNCCVSLAEDPDKPGLILGKGSVITQKSNLHFGVSREKRFCDGKEVGFFGGWFAKVCCTIRIEAWAVPDSFDLTLSAQDREVQSVELHWGYSQIEAKYFTAIRCGGTAPAKSSLEAAFGDLFSVKVLVPTDNQDALKSNINFQAQPQQTKIIGI